MFEMDTFFHCFVEEIKDLLKGKFADYVILDYEAGQLRNIRLSFSGFLINNELLEDLFLLIEYGKWRLGNKEISN